MKIIESIRLKKFEIIRQSHLAWERFIIKNLKQHKQKISFQCNICGKINLEYPIKVYSRETPSCSSCGSNMRARSIVDILTNKLFGESLILSNCPETKEIYGLGMSDWIGYSTLLALKFKYTNTYFHKEPKLDITELDIKESGRYDFIISSDVFEHIVPPVSKGFENLYQLLNLNGLCIITVPYVNYANTLEYYPDLYNYRIDGNEGHKCLINTTRSGKKQEFSKLKFHGGDGSTLELRCFTRSSLRKELSNAGFNHIEFHRNKKSKFGINWIVNWSLPISAKRNK
jgi:hypothetical protein